MRFLLSILFLGGVIAAPVAASRSPEAGKVSEKPDQVSGTIRVAGGRVDIVKGAFKVLKDAAKSRVAKPSGELLKHNPAKTAPVKRRYRNVDGSLSKPMTKAQRKAALKRRKTGEGGAAKKAAGGTAVIFGAAAIEGASDGVATVVTEKIIDGTASLFGAKAGKKKK